MATVRLPQTRGELLAAAAELIQTARHDLYGYETIGRNLGPTRITKKDDIPVDRTVESWLSAYSKMGAMEKGRLSACIEMTLVPYSEEIRALGAKRTVTILARRRWQGALMPSSLESA